MSSLLTTPKGSRLQIGVFGRRNVGKSSTLNALTRQECAIVSDEPGTTTDPVEKTMEMNPLGPILFIDTPGVDDESVLGRARVERTRRALERVDVALLVLDATLGDDVWGEYEERLTKSIHAPTIVILNKSDAVEPRELDAIVARLKARNVTALPRSAKNDIENRSGAPSLRDALIKIAPDEFLAPAPLVSDLIPPKSLVVLAVPIDSAAPKGRLILPQVQTIRDLLDFDNESLVVQPSALARTLERLREPPALVVTDSQAFKTVAAATPRDVPLTSFSILFARQKGDFATLIEGARAVERLTASSRVLIAEACSHHPAEEDIGTVKLPRLLRAKVNANIEIERSQGRDFPEVDELKRFDLIVHCGACVFNRREMLSRVSRASTARVPITNYGLALAALNGILERALEPFSKFLGDERE